MVVPLTHPIDEVKAQENKLFLIQLSDRANDLCAWLARKAATPLLLFTLTLSVFPAVADEINITNPPLTHYAGIADLADSYSKKTGDKVTVKKVNMADIMKSVREDVQPPDAIILPPALMDTLEKDGGIRPGSRKSLGYVELGLAVSKGAPHPDISTVAKLVAVLRSAKTVVYSDPCCGSMEAKMIDNLLKQPEFSGVVKKVSSKGDGAHALIRGEGDMALQLICEVLDQPEIELVGTLPPELHGYIDTDVAVSARAKSSEKAASFVAFITAPEATAVWKAKGLERR
jgi:molybdate transport system substrate-binding protein